MRWIVGFSLIAAAALKALELYLHPSTVLVGGVSPFLTPLLVGGELGLGLCALAGLYWRQLRLAAMVLFASFACFSLVLALQGATSCGCFGPLEINPWWTFLLDIAVFVGLIAEYIARRQHEDTSRDPANVYSAATVAGTVMTSLAVAMGLAWHVAPRQADYDGGLYTVGKLIVLEPESWIGKDFPLLRNINIDVSQGAWVLLLHRHDCPKCEEAVPKYEQLALLKADYQVAIVEVPPHDGRRETRSSRCHVGQLRGGSDWFVETPVEIRLDDGVVVSASTELPALNQSTVTEARVRNVHLQTSEMPDHLLENRGAEKL